MDVDWVATDPDSGQFSGIYATSTFREFEERLVALRARGEGYFQVGRVGHEYPYLILGFAGGHAVLYRIDSAETMLIHAGDGSVSRDDDVTVLVMEAHNPISGKFAMRLEHAWAAVEEFADRGATRVDEEWLQL